jgi:hypothetical protein
MFSIINKSFKNKQKSPNYEINNDIKIYIKIKTHKYLENHDKNAFESPNSLYTKFFNKKR